MSTNAGSRSEAFVAFRTKHYGALVLACQRASSPSEVEDLLQELLCRLWADQAFDPCRLDAIGYARKRLHFIIVNQLRSANRRIHAVSRSDPETHDAVAKVQDERAIEPWLESFSAQRREAVQEAIARFERQDQDIVKLRLAGHTFSEIDILLELTAGTAARRWYRALDELAAMLGHLQDS